MDSPIFADLLERARDGAMNSQHVSNLAWSVASLSLKDGPLLNSLSASSIAIIVDFSPQPLANTAWSCAKLEWLDAPLL